MSPVILGACLDSVALLRAFERRYTGKRARQLCESQSAGGNYNLLGENVLYTTLDHVTGIGASHDSFKFEYISYGTRIEHLTQIPAAYR